eukprot:2722604-Amphidinium_carterae.1
MLQHKGIPRKQTRTKPAVELLVENPPKLTKVLMCITSAPPVSLAPLLLSPHCRNVCSNHGTAELASHGYWEHVRFVSLP